MKPPKKAASARSALTTIALALFLAASAVLHFSELDRIPGVNGDEAEYGVMALSADTADAYAKAYLGQYLVPLVRVSILVFGATPIALRIWSALAMFALCALPLMHRGPNRGASQWLLAVGMLVHPAHLVLGRIGWDVVILPLVVYVVSRMIGGLHGRCLQRTIVAAAIGALAGVATGLHPTGWMLVPATAYALVMSLVVSARAESGKSVGAAVNSRSVVLPIVAALCTCLIAASRSLQLLGFMLLSLGGSTTASPAQLPLAEAWTQLISGSMAVRWVTGLDPWPESTTCAIGIVLLCCSLGGLLWMMKSTVPQLKCRGWFCVLHLAFGTLGLLKTDFGPPGNIRYAIGLIPSVLIGVAYSPHLVADVMTRRGGPRRRHVRLVVVGGLLALMLMLGVGWYEAFWSPMTREALSVGPTAAPGVAEDVKLSAARLIYKKQGIAAEPRAAIVPQNWDLYHTIRFFTRRRWPVLRMDSHEPSDFGTPLRELFATRERLYLLVFERVAGEREAVVTFVRGQLPQATTVERDTIPDAAGQNVLSVYTLERAAGPPEDSFSE